MAILDKLVVEKLSSVDKLEINNISDGENIFFFNEFENVKLRNETAEIIIECEQPNEEEYLTINPGEEIILNDYDYSRLEKDNNIFFPERYTICFISGDKTKRCFFNVKSNALGDKISDIRKIINDFYPGLELDLLNSIRGKNYIDAKTKIFTPLYEKIIRNEKMLQFELNNIIEIPIRDIKKNIAYSKKEGKLSRNKIKYDIRKNIANNDCRKSVIEKKLLSLDNYSNIVLKNSMRKIIKVCNELDFYFCKNIQYLEQNIIKKNNELERVKDKQGKTNSKRHGKKYIDNVTSEYYDLVNTVEINQEEKNLFLERQRVINKVRNNIINNINESWIYNIKDDYVATDSLAARKNIHYKKIIDFANEINAQYDNKYSNEGVYSYKKTSELYELYILILIIKILIKEKYEFLMKDTYDFNLLFENEEFIFSRDTIMVRIIYNKVVKRTDDFPIDELANQNSNSNKPDIVLMIYHDNVLVNCIIIEVKCRKKRNIYSRDGDTPVFTQLKDYTNFWYFTKDKVLKKNAIDKVYAIYPDDEPSKTFYNANQICFLSLEAVYDYEKSKGFANLYEELKAYI